MKTILNTTELRELLNKEEYKYVRPEKHWVRSLETHNKWTSKEVLDLFDTYLNQEGVPPTPDTYIEKGVEMTKEYWFRDSAEGRIAKYTYNRGNWETTYLTWSEDIEKGVRYRLSRMYESFMAEYSLICAINEVSPDSMLVQSDKLDYTAGIDLAVINMRHDSTFYIHVTKTSKWAEQNLSNKFKKKLWLKDISGRKHYWTRQNTEAHVPFFYDTEESKTTKEVNGHYIFKANYVAEEVAKMLLFSPDTARESELMDFHNFLIDNRIKLEGIRDMLVNGNSSK